MRPSPDIAYDILARGLDDGRLDREGLARALVEVGAAHGVVVADLGEQDQAPVTRSVVVQARCAPFAERLLRSVARGPLPDLSRPQPRSLETPAPVGLRGPGPLDPGDGGDLGPELRLVIGTETQVHTWLGLFGGPGGIGSGRRWRRALGALAPRLRILLQATRTAFVGVEGAVLVDGRGRLAYADPVLGGWLEPRASRLPVLLRHAHRDGIVEGPLDGARVRLRATNGPFGPAWLGVVTAPAPLERALDALLTPAQRRVAESAAVGATCSEIAETMGTTVETVRTHVRDIYVRLGISSRAELARRWAPQLAAR